jgi:carbon storage regulator
VLVLSRKVGESLIIGNEIRVKVVEVRGGQVRLGLEAPPEISVVREELHRAVAAANRQAAQPEVDALLDALAAVAVTQKRPEGSNGEGEDL